VEGSCEHGDEHSGSLLSGCKIGSFSGRVQLRKLEEEEEAVAVVVAAAVVVQVRKYFSTELVPIEVDPGNSRIVRALITNATCTRNTFVGN
jgi:hypothetical protein